VAVRFRYQKRRNTCHEITHCCRSACGRCKYANEDRRPNSDCERSNRPNTNRVAARSNERVDTAADGVECDSKPQEDKAGTRPTLRKAGKEPLQTVPPQAQRRARKSLAFFPLGLNPQNECFFCTPCGLQGAVNRGSSCSQEPVSTGAGLQEPWRSGLSRLLGLCSYLRKDPNLESTREVRLWARCEKRKIPPLILGVCGKLDSRPEQPCEAPGNIVQVAALQQ
jgi:hypothetical protein